MKTTQKILLLIMFLVIASPGHTQNRARAPQLRERILQAKLNEIQKSLQLDPSVMERFKPVYTSYEKELRGINFRELGGIMRINTDSLTAGEADRLVMLQLQNAKKLIHIREKYYPEFKTVLTPQQVIKLYQTEAEIRRKVMKEFRRRFGEQSRGY